MSCVDTSLQSGLIGDYGNAKEYRDPDPEFGYDGAFANLAENKARCYVESKDGAEFEILIRVDDYRSLDRWVYGDQGLEFHVLVDGHHMGKRLLSDYNFRNRRTWNTLFIGKKGPGADAFTAELRRFVFAPMTTSKLPHHVNDDDSRLTRVCQSKTIRRMTKSQGHARLELLKLSSVWLNSEGIRLLAPAMPPNVGVHPLRTTRDIPTLRYRRRLSRGDHSPIAPRKPSSLSC